MMNEMTMTSGMAEVSEIGKRFELSASIAKGMSMASLLPDHLRTKSVGGKIVQLQPEEVLANCVLICNQALRWGVDPFMALPCTYVVRGKLGFEGKLIGAVVNRNAGLKSSLSATYTGTGDSLECTVSGTLKSESEPRTASATVKQAKTENGMWKKDPEQILLYFVTRRWARRHCPEVLLGFISPDDQVEAVNPYGRDAERPALPEVSTDDNPADPELDNVIDATAVATDPADAATESVRVIGNYQQRMRACGDRDALAKIVDDVNAETDELIPAADKKSLVTCAKSRWSELDSVTV